VDSLLGQIFKGESKALYLKDVKEITLRHWELVKHIFGNDRKSFEFRLDELNKGRDDAHSNPTTEPAATQIEAIARSLLEQMAPYLE